MTSWEDQSADLKSAWFDFVWKLRPFISLSSRFYCETFQGFILVNWTSCVSLPLISADLFSVSWTSCQQTERTRSSDEPRPGSVQESAASDRKWKDLGSWTCSSRRRKRWRDTLTRPVDTQRTSFQRWGGGQTDSVTGAVKVSSPVLMDVLMVAPVVSQLPSSITQSDRSFQLLAHLADRTNKLQFPWASAVKLAYTCLRLLHKHK